MYLFHQQIIYFSLTILDGVVNPWINAGVNFIVATVGAYIISAILMKWKITRFLVGEKLCVWYLTFERGEEKNIMQKEP